MTQKSWGANANPDNFTKNGYGYIEIDAQYSPEGSYSGWMMLVIQNNTMCQQYIWHDNATDAGAFCWWRRKVGSTWSSWAKFDTNFPSFYKNYGSLSALKNAINAAQGFRQYVFELSNGDTYELETVNSLLFITCDGDWKLCASRYTSLTTIAEYNGGRFNVSYNTTTLRITHTLSSPLSYTMFELKVLA